jgi:hypothetical protein
MNMEIPPSNNESPEETYKLALGNLDTAVLENVLENDTVDGLPTASAEYSPDKEEVSALIKNVLEARG